MISRHGALVTKNSKAWTGKLFVQTYLGWVAKFQIMILLVLIFNQFNKRLLDGKWLFVLETTYEKSSKVKRVKLQNNIVMLNDHSESGSLNHIKLQTMSRTTSKLFFKNSHMTT